MKAIKKKRNLMKDGGKIPTDPRKKYSVSEDPTNPGMRNKGLKPLSKDYNWVDAGNRTWADINKDGKTGTWRVGVGAPWNATPASESPMTYSEVREVKKKNNLL